MNANPPIIPTQSIDTDNAPELTDEFFERAEEYVGDKLVRSGHPAPTGAHTTATTPGNAARPTKPH